MKIENVQEGTVHSVTQEWCVKDINLINVIGENSAKKAIQGMNGKAPLKQNLKTNLKR